MTEILLNGHDSKLNKKILASNSLEVSATTWPTKLVKKILASNSLEVGATTWPTKLGKKNLAQQLT